MKTAIHAFYVPGLGDHQSQSQELLLRAWIMYGVRVHYYPMYWSDKRTFREKFETFLDAIDATVAQTGGNISLIGASAGASAAINAYATRKSVINRVVCISGELNNPAAVSHRFKENPSFEGSLEILPANLASLNDEDRGNILSLHPIYDGVVPVNDTHIQGAHEALVPVAGHAVSIAYALTLGSRRISNFLRS